MVVVGLDFATGNDTYIPDELVGREGPNE